MFRPEAFWHTRPPFMVMELSREAPPLQAASMQPYFNWVGNLQSRSSLFGFRTGEWRFRKTK
jgi:hypothetical protein